MKPSTVLLLLLWLWGCDAFTGPGPLDYLGTYTLVAVDGAELPAPLLPSESSTRVEALSGWLRLDGEKLGYAPEFTISLTWRTHDADLSEVDSAVYTGIYARRLGDRFSLRFSGNRALCPPSGCGVGVQENGTYADSEFRFHGNPAELTFEKR